MATKIIEFPPRERTNELVRHTGLKPAKTRAKSLPNWLQELDVEWIFNEDAKRRTPAS